MSMTDDDLNALLAAWAQEDGSGGAAEQAPAKSAGYGQGGWQNKSQGGWQGGGGGGGWQQKQQGGGDEGGKSYGKSKGASPGRIANGEPVYYGRVKTYDKEKNRGYIACDEICDMVGMDVYVFGDVLSQAGAAPGDAVAFFCHWSKAGQPQASAPMLRLGEADSAGGFALKGEYKAGKGGAGFIVCDLVKEYFGRDVYVMQEFASNLQVGQAIAFNAYLNDQKLPAAERLEPCMPDWEPNLGDLSHTRTDPSVQSKSVPGGCSKGKGKGTGGDGGWNGGKGGDGGKGGGGKMEQLMSMLSGKGGGKASAGDDSWGGGGKGDDSWGGGDGGKGKGKGGGKMEMLMGMMGPLMGMLMGGDGWGDDSWGDDSWGGDGGWDSGSKGGKGWGSDKGKASGKGKDGKTEWKQPSGPPAASGETYYGVIKSFSEKKNFGFIASEQIQEKYNGVDCFFHGMIMEGHAVGDMVEFDVGLNSKGQPQAISMRALTLPDEGEPPSKQMKLF